MQRTANGLTRAEVRLEAAAIRGRWGLTPEDRAAVKQRMLKIVNASDGDDRVAVGAGMAVLAMDRVDIESERLERGLEVVNAIPFVVPAADRIGEKPE